MSLQKIGALLAVLGTLLIPVVVFASSSNDRDYDRDRDNDRYSYSCDRHDSRDCLYSYDSSYSSPYNYSYSYPQYYQASRYSYSEKSPNVSLTVVSLPNTGFEPQSVASIAFALLVLLGIGWVTYPYVRKAFTAVLR